MMLPPRWENSLRFVECCEAVTHCLLVDRTIPRNLSGSASHRICMVSHFLSARVRVREPWLAIGLLTFPPHCSSSGRRISTKIVQHRSALLTTGVLCARFAAGCGAHDRPPAMPIFSRPARRAIDREFAGVGANDLE